MLSQILAFKSMGPSEQVTVSLCPIDPPSGKLCSSSSDLLYRSDHMILAMLMYPPTIDRTISISVSQRSSRTASTCKW